MSKHFTPCPACGAVGEVNSTCQFCGTTILLKEGTIPSNARVIKQRTVTPQQYAEKVSIYHNVENINDKLIKVCIGNQIGIINLNGDLIFPLGNYSDIKKRRGSKEHIIEVYKEGECHHSLFNLETLEETDYRGLIKDKDIPQHLHCVDTYDWSPRIFKNPKDERVKYDYIEKVGDYIYILHKGDTRSLWLDFWIYEDNDFELDGADCILEGISFIGEIIEQKDKRILPIQMLNGQEINLVIELLDKNAEEEDEDYWECRDGEDIFFDLYRQTTMDFPTPIKEKIDAMLNVDTKKDVISETKNSSSQEGHKSLIGIEDFLKGVLYIILLSLSLLFVRWISGE